MVAIGAPVYLQVSVPDVDPEHEGPLGLICQFVLLELVSSQCNGGVHRRNCRLRHWNAQHLPLLQDRVGLDEQRFDVLCALAVSGILWILFQLVVQGAIVWIYANLDVNRIGFSHAFALLGKCPYHA